jgi:hypothetical protein
LAKITASLGAEVEELKGQLRREMEEKYREVSLKVEAVRKS